MEFPCSHSFEIILSRKTVLYISKTVFHLKTRTFAVDVSFCMSHHIRINLEHWFSSSTQKKRKKKQQRLTCCTFTTCSFHGTLSTQSMSLSCLHLLELFSNMPFVQFNVIYSLFFLKINSLLENQISFRVLQYTFTAFVFSLLMYSKRFYL